MEDENKSPRNHQSSALDAETPSPPSLVSAPPAPVFAYTLSGTVNVRDRSDLGPRSTRRSRLAAGFKCVAAPRARSAARAHGFDAVAYARRASRASLRTVNARQLGFRVRKER